MSTVSKIFKFLAKEDLLGVMLNEIVIPNTPMPKPKKPTVDKKTTGETEEIDIRVLPAPPGRSSVPRVSTERGTPPRPAYNSPERTRPAAGERKRKSLGVSTVTKVWQSVYSDFEAKCLMCNKNEIKLSDRSTWEVSHVIPFSAGGSDELDNLRPLCRACNRSMGSRSFKEHIMAWHEDRYQSLLVQFKL